MLPIPFSFNACAPSNQTAPVPVRAALKIATVAVFQQVFEGSSARHMFHQLPVHGVLHVKPAPFLGTHHHQGTQVILGWGTVDAYPHKPLTFFGLYLKAILKVIAGGAII